MPLPNSYFLPVLVILAKLLYIRVSQVFNWIIDDYIWAHLLPLSNIHPKLTKKQGVYRKFFATANPLISGTGRKSWLFLPQMLA